MGSMERQASTSTTIAPIALRKTTPPFCMNLREYTTIANLWLFNSNIGT